jgi:CCDC81-like prokaryotic HU domain 1/CCDC81-like prokaryotic HU domain 2/SPOR domain
MKIEEYISELLFENDCVIVPDFGGFVCNYAPARIDPVKHLWEPPGKRIIFNKSLTRNDGLLAHYISGKFKMPYSQVVESIAKEVKRYKENIEKDKRLMLENIGLLFLDENGNLLFQQDNKLNYLAESFGLSSFYYLPAEETKTVRSPEKKVRVRVYAAAAVITALVGSAFWFSMLEKQTDLRFSNLNIFAKREIPQYAFSPANYLNLPKSVSEPFAVFITNSAAPVTINKSTSPSPVNSKTITGKPLAENQSQSYSIIVGSFLEKEHADNLISQFNKEHISLSIIGRNPQGLYLVGYGKFSSHEAAASEKDNFRKKFIKDAWVKAI